MDGDQLEKDLFGSDSDEDDDMPQSRPATATQPASDSDREPKAPSQPARVLQVCALSLL